MCLVLHGVSMRGGVMPVIMAGRRLGRMRVRLSAAVGLFLLGFSGCRDHLYFRRPGIASYTR
jgi:hypothetical protein